MLNTIFTPIDTSQNLDLYDPFKVSDDPFERFVEETMFNGCCLGYEGIPPHEWVPANENAPSRITEQRRTRTDMLNTTGRVNPRVIKLKPRSISVGAPCIGEASLGIARLLEPDRSQIETFVLALFKHATAGNWISLRTFPDDREGPPFKITPIKLNGDRNVLIDEAYRDAELAANDRKKTVFCPPIATFTSNKHAREQDLAEGLVLSVECDAYARAARAKLEELLGPATVVVESGGEWTDPETGEIEPKLHTYHRLKAPAGSKDEQEKLKLARKLAATIVGGDPSNVPLVHPIRWPGSWHRKGEPKLCRIVVLNADAEVDLATALSALKKAAPKSNGKGDPFDNPFDGEQTTTPNWGELIGAVLSAEGYHEPLVRLAAKLVASGMADRAAGNLLRGLMAASVGPRDERWQARYDDIDRTVESAQGKYGQAQTQEEERAWPVLHSDALYGIAGKVVAMFDPHTESDPVALLMQFLVCFGNALGRGPHYLIEGTEHYTNLNALLIGETGKSRKGTSADRIRQLMRGVEPNWVKECIKSGLSSGEGLIWAIRDEVTKTNKEGEEEVVTEGVDDKRLLVDEREFFQALTVMKREGNTVSRMVRDGWDGKPLISLTKNSPARCIEPHISIIGHITIDELQRMLDVVSMVNGYANRFLFACVKRSKFLPFGGSLEQSAIDALAREIKDVPFKLMMNPKQIKMDAEARALWESVYRVLSEGQPGLVGAITQRGDAQTTRLALLYAALDGSEQIRLVHLKAALALWKYCEDSARYIFGDSIGDPLSDELLRALRSSGEMTRTQIRDLFKRNKDSGKIDAALAALKKYRQARSEMLPPKGSGPKVEVWIAVK